MRLGILAEFGVIAAQKSIGFDRLSQYQSMKHCDPSIYQGEILPPNYSSAHPMITDIKKQKMTLNDSPVLDRMLYLKWVWSWRH